MARRVLCAGLLLLGLSASPVLLAGCRADPLPGSPEATVEGDKHLRKMSDLLASSKVLRFETQETHDYLSLAPTEGRVSLRRKAVVRRPDRLFLEFEATGTAAVVGSMYYDGRTLTLNSDRHKVWAQAEVPATLDETFDQVVARFDLPLAVADLLYSSPYDALITPTTQGGFVGRERIGDRPCVHLAYTAEAVDFGIWIAEEGPPLPCRLEITYKQAPGPPTSRIDFTRWTLDTAEPDATFVFQPPDGSRRIPFVETPEWTAATSGRSPQ